MYRKTIKNTLGTYIALGSTMTKTPIRLRNILLALGILVALIVMLIFNASILADQTASVENPVNRINELAHYSIPNLLFHIF